jgi:hypothetical protein
MTDLIDDRELKKLSENSEVLRVLQELEWQGFGKVLVMLERVLGNVMGDIWILESLVFLHVTLQTLCKPLVNLG